ncbi:MAG: plasma-membrane proton-efflux P-type ATPase [Verrucomicrobia bacterium]|nr:plasma-membrane proton-efflux P-type ATPase [Verrucomicrobiota bacterium]
MTSNDPYRISSDDAKNSDIDSLYKRLHSSQEGLSSSEAKRRLEACGPNSIEEKKESLLVKVFHYFWGPIPWMIEIAAILSLIVGHWADFYIILALLLANGLVDFWEEFQAGNAIEALKKNLAPKSLVQRDGKWQEMDAALIVPGDVIRLRLGNIIPADAKLVEGEYLTVDQSTLTGESLPVTKKTNDLVFSGSVAKQGEMIALVTSTGERTFFGKTTKLVEKAKPVSHFQMAVLQIGDYLIYLSLALACILIIVQLSRHTPFLDLIQFVLILIIASIPVAMPAVLSVTMALGALKLSKLKAVVTKLESIEEIAGIDVLCCDKTGTLTQNLLTLGEPVVFNGSDPQTPVIYAALASKEENQDPIDLAILKGVKNPAALTGYVQEKFTPFDPVRKRTDAIVRDPEQKTIYVTKGAPQVVMALCHLEAGLEKQINETIERFAKKGHRTLGVARSSDGKIWEFLGLLPLFDPLRIDSIEMVKHAQENGIRIKMLTGDNISIAKEIAHQLQIGDNISIADQLIAKKEDFTSKEVIEKIEGSNGFAQVFPEHKYEIVKALQDCKHIVGMTGDGVNDSPALKQAEVGIAVSGATDAARAAASLVLLAPGLSVIIKAIEESRRIFERMNSYSIYRITETIRIMLFMVTSILAFNFYPVTAIMIILLALMNDLPILAIAYDNTVVEKRPVRWQMKRVLTIATVLGCIGIISTFILLIFVKDYLQLSLGQIQSFIFLKLSVAGHQTLFVTRTKDPFYSKPYPAPVLLIAILSTQLVAALLVGFGIFVTAIPWSYILLIWIYTLVWMFIADRVKILLYRHLDFTTSYHQKFLKTIKESFHYRHFKR